MEKEQKKQLLDDELMDEVAGGQDAVVNTNGGTNWPLGGRGSTRPTTI